MAKGCPIKVVLNDEYYIVGAGGEFQLIHIVKEWKVKPGGRRRELVKSQKIPTYHPSLRILVDRIVKWEWAKETAQTIEELAAAVSRIEARVKKLTTHLSVELERDE